MRMSSMKLIQRLANKASGDSRDQKIEEIVANFRK